MSGPTETDEEAESEGVERALLRQNLGVLLAALRANHIRRVEVHYETARGRCLRCSITTVPVNALPSLKATHVTLHRQAADAGQPERLTFTETVSLQDALQRFCLYWLSAAFPHWRTEDAGKGILRIAVEDGHLTLEHEAIHVERYRTTLKE